ncbi:sugar ABC transporter substrate-binding protein [Cohnella lubricantis]|uniref:Sugar ABC transporter substrate-binding protein n=1 Tax=Cohnella lubricantis TaxID=2163172 RepID=A0A841TEW1_9BACL|nr:sugar ABC transporter substrate-binding protein [Cohnella lubricantis]MBB6678519.1 sugar ABC transporter substrate-binding protein [Cohnella lubricantis]MBP2118442.1 multiple sugar transport system substrate-binding protein [Cohnella lubricantis]
MKRRGLSIVLASTLLALAGCGSSGGPGGDNASPSASPSAAPSGSASASASGEQEQVELRISWWGDQARADLTNKAIELFEQKNPNIKLTGEFAPFDGYFDKLNTQLASDTAPDIFFLGGNVIDYANKDVLLDLGPYVGNELKLDDMDPTMIEYGTVNGKLIHVSVGANARGIIVNKTMFDKAGIPVPQDGWTWDDYARISKEISDKLGDGYYGTYNFTTDGMDIYLKQNGKQLYDMANNKLGFEEADILPWFQYWDNTAKAGGVVPIELQVSNPPDDTGKSLLLTGKVAMTLLPSNNLVTFQGLTQDEFTMVQLPRGPKGTGVVFESSQGISGFAKTKHPNEVAKFIDFIINDPDAAKALGNNRGVPVTSANRAALVAEASPADKIVYDYTSRVSEQTKKEPFAISYNPPGNAEFIKLSDNTVQEIGFGKASVEKAVQGFYEGTVKIFESNQ